MSRLGKRQLHELYSYLRLTRRLEREIQRLHEEGRVPGSFGTGAGLEALSVGAAYPLEPGDVLSCALPSLGAFLVRGVAPREMVAHFLGRRMPPGLGREGPESLGDWSRALLSPAGHLAAHLGVMAGVAWGARARERPIVAVALTRQRALDTGDFHEAINFAAVHQLPMVVVVPASPSDPGYLYERIRGYGMPGLPVDAGDLLQVLQVVETAVGRARAGKGPTLIEARGVRLLRGAEREGALPIPFDAPEAAGPDGEAGDPVSQFERFLVDHELLDPRERQAIEDRIDGVLRQEIEEAENAPRAAPEGMEEDVIRRPTGSFAGREA